MFKKINQSSNDIPKRFNSQSSDRTKANLIKLQANNHKTILRLPAVIWQTFPLSLNKKL